MDSHSFLQKEPGEKLPPIPIDFDYNIYTADDKGNMPFRIQGTVNGNWDASNPGYRFSVTAQGHFEMTEHVEEKREAQLVHYSGLPMVINFIRSFILTVTASFPYGKYILPSLDTKSIIEAKE